MNGIMELLDHQNIDLDTKIIMLSGLVQSYDVKFMQYCNPGTVIHHSWRTLLKGGRKIWVNEQIFVCAFSYYVLRNLPDKLTCFRRNYRSSVVCFSVIFQDHYGTDSQYPEDSPLSTLDWHPRSSQPFQEEDYAPPSYTSAASHHPGYNNSRG